MTEIELKKALKDKLTAVYGKQDQWLIKRLEIIYLQIDKNVKKGMTYNEAIKKSFQDTQFEKQFYEKLKEDMVNSALLGANILDYESVSGKTRRELEKALIEKPWTPDRVPLSDRLHSNIKESIGYIQKSVNSALSDGKGVKKMAVELFDGYGYGSKLTEKEFGFGMNKKLVDLAKRGIAGEPIAKDEIDKMRKYVSQLTQDKPWNGLGVNTPLKQSYEDILTAIEKGIPKIINKKLWVGLQERARYNALRIARTETARSWFDGFLADVNDNPEITLLRYSLSGSHPKSDICDLHANLDVGYGKGFYPKDKAPPIPAHPHCLCSYTDYIRPIDKDVTDKDMRDSTNQWLKDNPSKAYDVLGSKDRVEAWKKGANPIEQIRGHQGFIDSKSRIQKIISKEKALI